MVFIKDLTWEILSADGEAVIQTLDIRVSFTGNRFVPATRHDPAEGGDVEFDGAEVLGNQRKHITLRPRDPAYVWAEAFFDAHRENFESLAAEGFVDARIAADEARYDRYCDERMERGYV